MNRHFLLGVAGVLGLSVLGAACSEPDLPNVEAGRQIPSPRADSLPAEGQISSARADSLAAEAALLAGLPESLRIRRGAFPGECGTYRDWTARAPIAVLSSPAVEADTVRMIDNGEIFHAETGHVEITGIIQVIVMRDAEGFSVGDTLLVLDYFGEGFWNVWHDGRVHMPERFWTNEVWTDSSRSAGYTIGEYSAEWWIQVSDSQQGTGWVWGRTASFEGAGRECGD